MGPLDVFGLLVACLCHDLDHRGTNNAFQLKFVITSLLFACAKFHLTTFSLRSYSLDLCLTTEGSAILLALSACSPYLTPNAICYNHMVGHD